MVNLNDVGKLKYVYKYLKTEAALSSLLGNNEGETCLRFSQPTQWEDKADNAVYNAKWKVNGNAWNKPIVYSCCITIQQANVASWISYLYGQDKGCIKLSLYYDKLIKHIDKWVKEHQKDGYKAYVGKLKYHKWSLIKCFGESDNECRNFVFQEANDVKSCFLRSLLLKREAYAYEKELRIFLVVDKRNAQKDSSGKIKNYLDIPVNWDECLNKIYIKDSYNKIKSKLEEKYFSKVDDSDLFTKRKSLEVSYPINS